MSIFTKFQTKIKYKNYCVQDKSTIFIIICSYNMVLDEHIKLLYEEA